MACHIPPLAPRCVAARRKDVRRGAMCPPGRPFHGPAVGLGAMSSTQAPLDPVLLSRVHTDVGRLAPLPHAQTHVAPSARALCALPVLLWVDRDMSMQRHQRCLFWAAVQSFPCSAQFLVPSAGGQAPRYPPPSCPTNNYVHKKYGSNG